MQFTRNSPRAVAAVARRVATPVQSVRYSSGEGAGSASTMRYASLVGCVGIGLWGASALITWSAHDPEETIYPHMRIVKKPFPWKDGKTPLFVGTSNKSKHLTYEDSQNQ